MVGLAGVVAHPRREIVITERHIRSNKLFTTDTLHWIKLIYNEGFEVSAYT